LEESVFGIRFGRVTLPRWRLEGAEPSVALKTCVAEHIGIDVASVYPLPQINSGPTHREGHDRTNSLQNSKLPDWAIINLAEPPTDMVPGKIVAIGLFDESWQPR
jgi:hypothetical protein